MGEQLPAHAPPACHAAGQRQSQDAALLLALVLALVHATVLHLAGALLTQQMGEQQAAHAATAQEPASDQNPGEVVITKCYGYDGLLLV
ncbi:hypothetical protein ACRAWG_26180 [Methylobacterium sp. P31]